ncbi:tryptophan dimethylallyltransferase family protein [Kitasatospora phosalacinea]|uniref:tryptophan dimethylallyltransferase family protein n=1 Tax=Kitasatospora phosalacinea TaxID=2065 RepID=UPI001FD833B4|nr:tryptophan dimethylallyltransferase family protein [Kitasatospora phosalacinea]
MAPAHSGRTVGSHTGRQLLSLCELVGLDSGVSAGYARALTDALGPVVRRSLDLPPAAPTFLSDDHTPVEFSLSFSPGAAPSLRVLFEPSSGFGTLAESSRLGLRALHGLARRWGISTEQLDLVQDLFLPDDPQGDFALWITLELTPGGTPRMKAYLNPAAAGPDRAGATVREALRRLGHHRAYDSLPPADRLLLFALDLGDWAAPRLKVYTAHHRLRASAVGALNRMADGPAPAEAEAFLHTAAGLPAGRDGVFDRRPVLACHSFTDPAADRPSGFTLHVPVRDYARDDHEVLGRAERLLPRYGILPDLLRDALGALTPRRLEDGVGLIAYLAMVHQQGHAPRLTAYLSSEAYRVRRPNGRPAGPRPAR